MKRILFSFGLLPFVALALCCFAPMKARSQDRSTTWQGMHLDCHVSVALNLAGMWKRVYVFYKNGQDQTFMYGCERKKKGGIRGLFEYSETFACHVRSFDSSTVTFDSLFAYPNLAVNEPSNAKAKLCERLFNKARVRRVVR